VVKRLLALLAGGLGLTALLRRRRRPAAALDASPAHELRERLAESRAAEAEQPATPAAAPDSAVADRRRDVHERARGAIDELS